MALDSLKDRDPHELEHDRDELRKRLSYNALPGVADLAELRWVRERARQALEATDRRIDRLQDLREQIGLLHFRERAELGQQIADALDLREQRLERSEIAAAEHDLARGRLARHLPRPSRPARRRRP